MSADRPPRTRGAAAKQRVSSDRESGAGRDHYNQQHQQQQQKEVTVSPFIPASTTTSSSSFGLAAAASSSSSSSLEEVKRSLQAVDGQRGLLITDHSGAVVTSSGDLSSPSLPSSLFYRLFLDARGLLDHSRDTARDAMQLQAIHVSYSDCRYVLTMTSHYLIAVKLEQTDSSTAAANGQDRSYTDDAAAATNS